jgi:DNA polymerase-1
MRYLTFGEEKSSYPIALLTRLLRTQDLAEYVQGIEQDVVALAIPTNQKAKVTELKQFIQDQLLPSLVSMQTDYVLCTDGALFKVLTGAQRVDRVGGYVMACKFKDYEHVNVIYVPSPQQLIYDPTLRLKLAQGLRALQNHRSGRYIPPGIDIIQEAHYPQTIDEISGWLRKLVDQDLACDIEAFSLKHFDAGIGSISMAWSKHAGIAFPVDLAGPKLAPVIRGMLREFFNERAKRAKTKTIWHNGSYDCYVLTYQLYMKDLLDTAGLLDGLATFMEGFEDTQLITYLATNSCAGNQLGLKAQAQEFAGNYMVDVSDIRQVPLPRLLEYNLVDSLATWFVFEKHYDTMVNDQQLGVYEELFKPCIADIIQMQLTGLPVDMEEVKSGKAAMELDRDNAVAAIKGLPAVAELERRLTEAFVEKKNAEYKKKRITAADVAHLEDCKLNLNSPMKLQKLLFEVMGLPVISTTDTGQPGTDGDTIEALINHTQDPNHKFLLQNLIDFKAVDKILSAFIPAFEAAPQGPDGWHYLFGFFNLGGTLSGRLSSNGPNLQNLPATGSRYAKMIKQMFRAPPGWLFVGLDFNSLEDRISALTTKDPNKIKVYTDGYDGHSLRAFFYFRDQMPDIQETVSSINSIQAKYKSFRQDSKAPTFALTYQGTYRTLMVNCGFSEEKAKKIEKAYHEMYQVSDKWVQDRLATAARVGYVTVAFGLRLRTPMLRQCVLGTRKTPYEATAEGRTAGNAMGQSYGLLNSRAAMAFGRDVRASKYRLDVKPCAQIHDAQYYLVRNDVTVIAWVNKTLVPHIQWQELPEIQHPQVKLGGDLSIFYPTWANELTIPNGADADQILSLAKEHMKS